MKKPLDVCLKSVYPLKAVGYTNTRERKEYDCNDSILSCSNQDLVSLDIPEGVKYVSCYNNFLTKLNIPEGVKEVWCRNNNIKELNLPDSIETLSCDKIVLGLDNIDWDCHIFLY